MSHRAIREEIANTVTHAFGLTLATFGAIVLIALALVRGSEWHVFSVAVYGMTLVVTYTASTVYHALRKPRWKRIFRIADHAAIYLLIAGTYTPFSLITLRGPYGYGLFAAVWVLTVVGVAWKIYSHDRFPLVSTITYLLMGWMAVLVLKPLVTNMPVYGLVWLFAGGTCYSVGVIFFASRRIPYAHAVWHVFVMLGSICHYVAVMLYVLPQA